MSVINGSNHGEKFCVVFRGFAASTLSRSRNLSATGLGDVKQGTLALEWGAVLVVLCREMAASMCSHAIKALSVDCGLQRRAVCGNLSRQRYPALPRIKPVSLSNSSLGLYTLVAVLFSIPDLPSHEGE